MMRGLEGARKRGAHAVEVFGFAFFVLGYSSGCRSTTCEDPNLEEYESVADQQTEDCALALEGPSGSATVSCPAHTGGTGTPSTQCPDPTDVSSTVDCLLTSGPITSCAPSVG